MQQLDAINGKIRCYLDGVGPAKWSRFHMPTNRYSTMTSNIVEHRETAQATFTTLSSKYEKQIREMSMDIRNLRVARINQTMFSTSCENLTFVVDIEGRTCTCRMLQVDQLPCPHALAVIARNRNEWIVSKDFENIVVLPPNQKRSCGTPSEKRFSSAVENNITVQCGHCGESSHNCRTCSSLVGIGYSLKEPVTCVVTITVRTITGGLLHLLHNK
ncbi:uncharacterized protein LOC111398368 [Olea europaea var. sylvestris]|uniref:uncharacterized protein LOC111398368 n=1 Tax=Olea europaea var. sylvestris TaxID=158386 RepID=UPI000C1CCD27|nr:uncharacterized protein LOC111398368 [Olea europaea var. sylvestris]